jgi:hypothetical protein
VEFSEPARGASPNRISVALVARTTLNPPTTPVWATGLLMERGASLPQGRPRTSSPNTFAAYLSAQHFLGAEKSRRQNCNSHFRNLCIAIP